MADNLKAASYAAQLTPEEQKRVDDFNKALTAHKELTNLPQDAAQAKYAKYTPAQQEDLKKKFGNEDPTIKPQRGWLGTAWHYTGEQVGNAIGYAGSSLLAGLGNASDLMTRVYRTAAIAIDQDVALVGSGNAWDIANDKGDKVFSPGRILDAKVKFGNDAVSIAQRIASGEDISKIKATATPEQQKYIMLADPTNKKIPGLNEKQIDKARGLFQDTLDAVQASKYSPGRQIANAVLPGQLEGSGFFYKAISGAFDAAYRIFADPLLVAGKVKRFVDVGNYALDVVVGKGGVADYFAKPQSVNFWNQYGAKLGELKKAQDLKTSPEDMLRIRKELEIMAPELGPAVQKSLLSSNVPVTDAKTAQAFFENTKQLKETMLGQVGRQRILLPRMDLARKTRIAAVTTGRKVLNLDAVGPKLVDDTWFGGAATTDGIAETIINNQKVITDLVTKKTNFKGIARFSTDYIQYRIDRAKAAFSIAPIFDDVFDVTEKGASDKIYSLAVMVMPTRESRLLAQAFDSMDEVGKKKDVYYGLWSTIAEIRGMNTTQPGQQIVRYLTGKGQAKFGIDDLFPDKGSLPSDFNNFVAAPSLADIDRAAARNGLFQNMIGIANSDLASRMTSAWSFLTLAGPRYALRNAGEDLMVNLAIGESAWGIAKSRMLSTRINTYLQAVKKVEGGGNWSDNPLGMVMRLVNKKEVNQSVAELTALQKKFDEGKDLIAGLKKELKDTSNPSQIKKIEAEIKTVEKDLVGGITTQSREIFARALSQGRVNRLRASFGKGPMSKEEIELLTEQIKYGDIENALSIASEGGLNYVTGNDYITRAANLAKQTGVRVHALEIKPSKENFVKKPGERGFKEQALNPQDEASMFSWLMQIGRYSNDDLGKIAVANLADDAAGEAAAIKKMLKWTETKAGQQYLKDARLSNNMDAQSLMKLAYDRSKSHFVKRDGTINNELLDKVRTKNQYGEFEVSGRLSIDDLPQGRDDIPAVIIGPTLVPAVETGQITSNLMTNGWTFLGMANARMSRQPIVLDEIIKIRKQMRSTGFEDAWIKSYTKGMDPDNTTGIAIVTERAKKDFAEMVEERATSQILQYVDNPLVRTQLAFSARNFARFYRATEDFYRRMYRVVRYNPEAIAKAALTYEGITHSGWVQKDDQGQDYFVYPAIGPVYNAVQKALDGLGIGSEFKVPFPVQFGAQVKMLTPSLNPESIVPTFSGPISGASVTVISSLVNIFNPGAADTIKGYALGKYAVDQPILSAFLPAHVNRLISVMDQDDRNSQYASAWRKAVTYLEAGGHGLPKRYDESGNLIPPTPSEQEEYRLAVKNATLSILGMRFVFGFFAPASPQVQLKSDMAQWISDNGRANFKQAFTNLSNQYEGDYNAAMAKWIELFPNQIPFTITETERKTIAPLRYAEEAGLFVEQNEQLFKDYGSAAAFLIPHKSGFSWDAYKTMKDIGLTQNKRVDDYLREVQTAADLQEYYARKNAYEAQLSSSVIDFERIQARQEFDDWKKVFFAGRPLVQEELSQGGEKAIARQRTLDELQVMLSKNLDVRPKTESKLREMLAVYQDYQTQSQELDALGFPQQLSKTLKEETIIKLRQMAIYNENTQGAYDVLFGRLLGD